MKIQNAQDLKKDSTFYINRDMPVSEIMEKSPKAVELLALYGIHCASCFFSGFDTLENGAKLHGLSDEQLDSMILEINMELAK